MQAAQVGGQARRRGRGRRAAHGLAAQAGDEREVMCASCLGPPLISEGKLRWIALQRGCLYYFETPQSGRTKGFFTLSGYRCAIGRGIGRGRPDAGFVWVCISPSSVAKAPDNRRPFTFKVPNRRHLIYSCLCPIAAIIIANYLPAYPLQLPRN
jgi:hypothetical protein